MSDLTSYSDVALSAQRRRPAFSTSWHPELMQYAASFQAAAAATSAVDACMLAAIVLRESGGRNVLQDGMPPGPDCGVGICQITYKVDWSNPAEPAYPGYGALLDPATNLRVAAIEFLNPLLTTFPGNHIAAFAAYNCGPGAVQAALRAGRSPDSATTGQNYGSEVFKSWINFAAASMGMQVNWAGFSGTAPVASPPPNINGDTSDPTPAKSPAGSAPASNTNSDLTDF